MSLHVLLGIGIHQTKSSVTLSTQVRDYLLRQKACFDLLLLAQEMELRRWKTCQKHLCDVKGKLKKEGEEVSLRIKSLAHPDLIINPKPNPIISSKDAAFSR